MYCTLYIVQCIAHYICLLNLNSDQVEPRVGGGSLNPHSDQVEPMSRGGSPNPDWDLDYHVLHVQYLSYM